MYECNTNGRNELAQKKEHIRQLRFSLAGLLAYAKRFPASAELVDVLREAELCLTSTRLFEPPYPVWIQDLTETGETCYLLDHRAKNMQYGTVMGNPQGAGYCFVVHSETFTVIGSSLTLEGAKADVEFAIGMRDRLEFPAFSAKAAASAQ